MNHCFETGYTPQGVHAPPRPNVRSMALKPKAVLRLEFTEMAACPGLKSDPCQRSLLELAKRSALGR